MIFSSIMNSYFDSYNKILTDEYLENNGINLEEAYNHFNLKEENLASSDMLLPLILGLAFTYTILAICLSASNMAILTTANEKENGTLETILIFPITKN